MPTELERRFIRGELRAQGEGDERRIVGYAAVFNQLSKDLGGFREMLMPGAFTRTLNEADVRALLNHDPNLILGRSGAGTLVLVEDDIGLRYEIMPPDTQYARDLLISLDRKDIDQSSFAFRAVEESWKHPNENEPLPIRVLHDVDLFDVSPVTFPAYPTTSVSARDMSKIIAGEGTGGEAVGGAVRRLAHLRRRLQLVEL